MKLPLIVLTILVYTVVVSGGVTAAIFKSLSVRSALMVGLMVVLPVLSSLLAMWITMTGKRPLWRVVFVTGIAAALAYVQLVGVGIQGFAISVMVCFAMAAVPFVIMRTAGIVLADISRLHKKRVSIASTSEDTSVVLPKHTRWTVWSLLSTITAVAVLMALLQSSIRCVPPSTKEMFLGRETVLVAGYFSLALPLIMSAILSVSTSVSRVATIVLILVVVSAVMFFVTCFQDWQIIPIVIAMPTVCLGIGCGMLYLAGFRLLLPDRSVHHSGINGESAADEGSQP